MTEKRLAAGEVNYPGIGSTEHGRPPEGYPCLVTQTYLGEGLALYHRVAQGILTWELQRRSGLRVRTESGVVVTGARVVSGFGVGPFRIKAPCEVVWVRRPVPGEGPQSAGFGYGTLPGHVFVGEESFVLERDAAGDVWFVVDVFSNPAARWVRALRPLVPIFQRLYIAHLARAARRLARDL